MTSAAPIFVKGYFYGVAAVDILVSRIEQEILQQLTSHPSKLILTNAINRIIFSNVAKYRVGDIIRNESVPSVFQHELFTLYVPE